MVEDAPIPSHEGVPKKPANPYLASVAPSARERRPAGVPATPPASEPVPEAAASVPRTPAPPPPPPPPASYGGSVPGLEVAAPVHAPGGEGAFSSAHTTAHRPRRAGVEERLSNASTPSLRTRRARIETRIFELAFPIGEAALGLERLRATKLVDIDRVLKKLDRVDDEIFELEKAAPRPEGILGALTQNVGKLADKLGSREIKEKRRRLVAELGLALLAADRRVLDKRASEVSRFVSRHAAEAEQVDELFQQSRFVDLELDLRARDGRLYREPKVLERVVEKTGEVVGDATDAATDKLKDLGKQAAKAAVKQGGKAIMGLASGAMELGRTRMDGDDEDDSDDRRRRRKKARDRDADEDPDADDSDEAPPAAKAAPQRDVAALLRDLARLHKDGILTDAEYARKKADLLDRL